MSKIDVSELMIDTDFVEPSPITVNRQTHTISDYGETVLTTSSQTITAIVQMGNTDALKRNPEAAVMHDLITVYSKFVFISGGENNYADRVVFGGRNYLVSSISDYSNWGAGYTRADCLIEGVQ